MGVLKTPGCWRVKPKGGGEGSHVRGFGLKEPGILSFRLLWGKVLGCSGMEVSESQGRGGWVNP